MGTPGGEGKVKPKLDLPPTHKVGEYTFTDRNKDEKIDGTDTVRAPGGESMTVAEFEKKFAVQLQKFKEYTKLSDAVTANKLFMPDPEMVSDSMRAVNNMSDLEERSTVMPGKEVLTFRYSDLDEGIGRELRVKVEGYAVKRSDANAISYLKEQGYSFFKMKAGVRDSNEVFAFKRDEAREAMHDKYPDLDTSIINELVKGFSITE